MFDFLTAFGVIVGIAFFVYKWIELVVMKKERIEIASRLEGDNLMEYAKRMPLGLGATAKPAEQDGARKPLHPVGKVLRWGMFVVGLGAGCFLGGFIQGQVSENFGYVPAELSMAGCVLLCSGLGLVISFVVEYFLYKSNK
ncbi:MAG: hypothetical protein E7131_06395 [Rikenellaceae bacterium]|nr:hypothetical protein [Rikenellaceae bacterium]